MNGVNKLIILMEGKLYILYRLLFFLTIILGIGEFIFFILTILSSGYVEGLY